MAKKIGKSYEEAKLIELSESELKDRALQLFQTQRDLKESKSSDSNISEHMEYMRETYSIPNSDIESEIKVLRRIFRLKGIRFNDISIPEKE